MMKGNEGPDAPVPNGGPPPLPHLRSEAAFRLSERERAVAAELERLDPQLAGLYTLGLELASRDQVPGVSYLVAEAGRELSVGVVNALAADAPALSAADIAAIDENDRHRATIARALRLSPRHPLVDAWAEMHRRFNGEAHFVANRTSPSSAISDFRVLAELLRGRLAPYFDAQDEADALLAIESPTGEHLEALRRILVRPALRTYFLRALHNPGWLRLLIELGAFSNPPRRVIHPDGSWSLTGWLEGEFLARIAGAEPGAVAELLRSVSSDNDNPAVWDAVARAAAALPASMAVPVVRQIVVGLRSVPRVVLPQALIEVGRHIAPVDTEAAVELVNTLLWMRRRSPEPPMGEEEQKEEQENASLRWQFSTAWLLVRVDLHDAQEIIGRLVPAIVPSDAHRALELLRDKLRAAMKGVDVDANTHTPRQTTYWCRDFDGSDDHDDVRAMFARALAKAAADTARVSEGEATWVESLLGTLPPGIGRRILYYVVSRCGPFLTGVVNGIISNPKILEWEMPGREVGEVLRNRFDDASSEAQLAFVGLLEHGPGQGQLDHLIAWAAEAGEDDSPEAARAYWQRKHLRRFGSRLPRALQRLADSIGLTPSEPTIEELALTEDGSYSGGAHWVAERSPIEPERLRDTPLRDLARVIVEWRPEPGIDRPSLRGLEEAIERMTAEDPARGLELATVLIQQHQSPRGVTGVLRGIDNARKSQRAIPWDALQDVLHNILSRYPDAHASEWRQVRAATVDVIHDAVVDDVPAEVIGSTLAGLERLLAHPTTWEDDAALEVTTMDGVLSASLTTLAGRTVSTVIQLVLREYRAARGGEDDTTERADGARRHAGERLRVVVAQVLEQHGRPAVGARASLGTYLPQLVWADPGWWAERAGALIGTGISEPLSNPIWSAYLAGGRFFDQTFRTMRSWYVAAARAASSTAKTDGGRTWEPERHLAEHVLIATVRGLAAPGDEDTLLEQVVRNVPLDDLSHAYWTIFRGWSDTEVEGQNVPPEMGERLVRFWTWRIEELERDPENPRRRAEADALVWFCLTPFVPAADAIRLGSRTLAMAGAEHGTVHSLLERLPALVPTDVNGVFELMERAIGLELQRQYPYLSADDVQPVFAAAFAHGSPEIKRAALALLNRLGDAGYSEFGKLRPW